MDVKRCSWCNTANKKYVLYHDNEWGKRTYDERKLYEIFILECFQAGLSWECILNKRENFALAFDNFDPYKVKFYGEEKINELCRNEKIIRHRKKIEAAVKNTAVYLDIVSEYGSFNAFIESFAGKDVIYETDRSSSPLSDAISGELKKRGMKFAGSITVYSFLCAAGYINAHEKDCFVNIKLI